jgi:hypothetical protein
LVRIELLEDNDGLDRLRPFWNRLLDKSRTRSVFLTWEWIKTWWEIYSSDFRLWTLVAYRLDEPCGIAPLVIRNGASPRLEFIGQNKAWGEYLDFIISRGMEEKLTPALCGCLSANRHDWQRIHFATMLASSPNLPLIYRVLRRSGVEIAVSSRRNCPFIQLPPSWDIYLTSKGRRLRKRLRYNENRLSRLGELLLEFASDTAQRTIFLKT